MVVLRSICRLRRNTASAQPDEIGVAFECKQRFVPANDFAAKQLRFAARSGVGYKYFVRQRCDKTIAILGALLVGAALAFLKRRKQQQSTCFQRPSKFTGHAFRDAPRGTDDDWVRTT